MLINQFVFILTSHLSLKVYTNVEVFVLLDKPKLDYDNKFRDIVTLNSGSTLKIPVKVSGLPKPSVTWSKDDKPVRSHGRLTIDISDRATTLTLKKVTRDDDGLYSILAENEAGQATAKFDIEVIGKCLCYRNSINSTLVNLYVLYHNL